MSIFERIRIKTLGNTAGHDFNMWDWDISTLADKVRRFKPLTKAEAHAKRFLESVGEAINVWDPPKKWEKPYGDVLNETRKLH